MKLRRTFLAFVVLAGFLVLILGVTGVLSPKRPEAAASKAGEQGGATITDFKVETGTWSLHADQARPLDPTHPEAGYKLINPSLEVKKTGPNGEEHLKVQASEGSTTEKEQHVRMSGGVRVEFSGAENIVLTTPSAEVEPEQATGRTADEVEVVVDAKEGRQHIWGKGAEFTSKQRLIVISENIRMELTGAGSDIFPQAEAGKAATSPAGKPAAAPTTAEAPVTKIQCRGPATADGFKRTVVLNGDVQVHQGESELRADRVEVDFSENSRTPDRFVADGAVTFKASGAEGDCDRLERSAAEDSLRLEGKPARVHRGANEIKAARIELSGGNMIVVQAPGSLKLAGEEAAKPATNPATSPAGKPAETMTVTWSRMLRLDPNEHQALFLGDVHFAGGGQTIECQTLTVKLDSDNGQILGFTAETGVHFSAQMQGGAAAESVTGNANELTYDPKKDSVLLSGRAALQQGERTISGERIEIHPKDAEIAVAGAGALEGQAEKDSEKFSVSWEREMRFSRAKERADFKGGVGLKYGGNTLHAESVTAGLSGNTLTGFDADGGVRLSAAEGTLHADRLKAQMGDNTLKAFQADGGVVFDQAGGAEKPRSTLKADKLSAEMGADRKPKGLDATGHVTATWTEARAEHPTWTLTADKVKSEMDDKTKLQGFEATGHAALRHEGAASAGKPADVTTMRAATMTAKMDAQNQMQAFEAVGRPVIVEQEGSVARGERLTWDAQRDSGVLFGSPAEVRLGQNRLFGDRVEFAPKHGAITVFSNRRVEATVVGGAPGGLVPLP